MDKNIESMVDVKNTKKVVIEGIEYIFQKLPVRSALEVRSRCRDAHGNPDDVSLYEEMLTHVVIQPKKSIDDFTEIAHLEKVMKAVLEFQYQGK